MKKTLMSLGMLFIIVIVLELAGFILLVGEGKRLDRESKAFVDALIPEMCAKWTWQLFYDNASPQLVEVTSYEHMEQMFNRLSGQIGGMTSYTGSKGKAKINFSLQGIEVTGKYVATGKFEKGYGEIRINLVLKNRKWQLLSLNITSMPMTEDAGMAEKQAEI